MDERTRLHDAQEAGLIDDSAGGVNDDPVVRKEACDLLGIILDHRLPKFFFDFNDFLFHFIAAILGERRRHHGEHKGYKECVFHQFAPIPLRRMRERRNQSPCLQRITTRLDQLRDSVLDKFFLLEFSQILWGT